METTGDRATANSRETNPAAKASVLGATPGAAATSGRHGADNTSLTALYAAHFEQLRSILGARLTGSDIFEREDAIQDAFLRLLERRSPDLEVTRWANPLGYLLIVARNACIDWRRRRVRDLALPHDVVAAATGIDEAGGDESEASLQASSIAAYVRALPDGLRAVYVARFVEGRSQQNAARRLGVTRRAVRTMEKQLLVEVRRMLRQRASVPACDGV